MQAPAEGSDAITGINVTPLVDVILVLLIIFMATAPLLHRRALRVSVPRAARSERQATQTLRVELSAQRRLSLDGRSLSLADLLRELGRIVAHEPGSHVALAADEGLPYGEVVHVLDEIRRAGVRRIGLEVRSR